MLLALLELFCLEMLYHGKLALPAHEIIKDAERAQASQ